MGHVILLWYILQDQTLLPNKRIYRIFWRHSICLIRATHTKTHTSLCMLNITEIESFLVSFIVEVFIKIYTIFGVGEKVLIIFA